MTTQPDKIHHLESRTSDRNPSGPDRQRYRREQDSRELRSVFASRIARLPQRPLRLAK